MRKVFIGITLLLVVSPELVHAAELEVSGWIPYWRSETAAEAVHPHLDGVTEVNPFGYSVSSSGTLLDTAKMRQPPWPELITEAQKKKVRVIPTVMWSDGEAIHQTLSNTDKRRALATEIADLVKNEGYDGIDINFENKHAETKDYFSLFLKGLYTKMGNKWVMCSIEARTPLESRYTSLPPAHATQYANDHREIGKYCDRVRIMTYDQGGVDVRLRAMRSAPYLPVSDPAWVEKAVLETAKSIPLKKIVIGIPTYGYEHEMLILPDGTFSYKQLKAFNPKYALDIAANFGITPSRNEAGEMSFVYAPTTTPTTIRVLWWSDATAIRDKILLAQRLGVRGVAVFKFDDTADPALWKTLKTAR